MTGESAAMMKVTIEAGEPWASGFRDELKSAGYETTETLIRGLEGDEAVSRIGAHVAGRAIWAVLDSIRGRFAARGAASQEAKPPVNPATLTVSQGTLQLQMSGTVDDVKAVLEALAARQAE